MTASATGVPPGEAGLPGRPVKTRTRPAAALLEPAILRHALLRAVVKLDPRLMVKIPVMFVVEIGSVITTIEFFARTVVAAQAELHGNSQLPASVSQAATAQNPGGNMEGGLPSTPPGRPSPASSSASS